MKLERGSRADDLNFYSLLAVLQSGMWLRADIESYLAPFGLSHGRFSILLSLQEADAGGVISRDLATLLGVSKPTVTKMVAKLVDEQLIYCTAGTEDSRRKQYHLTEKATDLLHSIIPGYRKRMREMTDAIPEPEKLELIAILSKLSFLNPNRSVLRPNESPTTVKATRIRSLCKRGRREDIDAVLAFLDENTDLPTTKFVDYYLSTVTNPEGIHRIEHYLFKGTQIQRNYCTLYFARKNEWTLVNKAYRMGLVDYAQAYSR